MLKNIAVGRRVWIITDYQEQLFVLQGIIAQRCPKNENKYTVVVDTEGAEILYFTVFENDLFASRAGAEAERKRRERYA